MNRLSSSSAGFSAFRAADLDAADELPSAVLDSAFPKILLANDIVVDDEVLVLY